MKRKLITADNRVYRTVRNAAREEFGEESKAFRTLFHNVDVAEGKGASPLLSIYAHQKLSGFSVASIDQIAHDFVADPTSFIHSGIIAAYWCAPQVVLRSADGVEPRADKLLENVVLQVEDHGLAFSPDNPLVISYPTLIKDADPSNAYGLRPVLPEDPRYLSNDPRFKWGADTITFSGKEFRLATTARGLSGVNLYLEEEINTSNHSIHDSATGGRILLSGQRV